jgi:hypothetical protein
MMPEAALNLAAAVARPALASVDLRPGGAETHDWPHPERCCYNVSSSFDELAPGEWWKPAGSLHSFRTLR